MKFPVPHEAANASACLVCGAALAGEPGRFAYINGGALRRTGPDSAVIAPDLLGFLAIGMHGADDGQADERSAHVYIADDAVNGQFEFYFCSPSCLRTFFAEAVDELERRLSAQAD